MLSALGIQPGQFGQPLPPFSHRVFARPQRHGDSPLRYSGTPASKLDCDRLEQSVLSSVAPEIIHGDSAGQGRGGQRLSCSCRFLPRHQHVARFRLLPFRRPNFAFNFLDMALFSDRIGAPAIHRSQHRIRLHDEGPDIGCICPTAGLGCPPVHQIQPPIVHIRLGLAPFKIPRQAAPPIRPQRLPFLLRRLTRQCPDLHGIQVDVARQAQQIVVALDQLRHVAPLETVPRPRPLVPEIHRIRRVQSLHEARQIGARRLDQQVVVVRHQRPCVQHHPVPLNRLPQLFPEPLRIHLTQHDSLPPISAAGHVIDRPRKLFPARSWHASFMPPFSAHVNINTSNV